MSSWTRQRLDDRRPVYSTRWSNAALGNGDGALLAFPPCLRRDYHPTDSPNWSSYKSKTFSPSRADTGVCLHCIAWLAFYFDL